MIKTVLSAALILTTATVAFADTTKPRHAAKIPAGQKANAAVVTHTSATTKGGATGKRGSEPMKQCVIGHPAAGCF
jgi:hypothetical protein